MDFSLRPVEARDVADLQVLYEASPGALRDLIGRPALPDQAANDYDQARRTPGRYQFAMVLDGRLVGLADCIFDDAVAGLAHIGLLLLRPPYDDPVVRSLAARMLARWLSELGALQLEVSVPAHAADQVRFWWSLGFEFTGDHYRRDLPGYAPRFLIMQRDINGFTSATPS